jgi:hypothetical protein
MTQKHRSSCTPPRLGHEARINVRNFGPHAEPKALAAWARFAEDTGFTMAVLSDHVAPTPDVDANYPRPFYDPFVILAWWAGLTDSLLLGTSVAVLPYRKPLLTARMATNIDQFSNGAVPSAWVPDGLRSSSRRWACRSNDVVGSPMSSSPSSHRSGTNPTSPGKGIISHASTTSAPPIPPAGHTHPSGSAAWPRRQSGAPPVSETSGTRSICLDWLTDKDLPRLREEPQPRVAPHQRFVRVSRST